MKLRIQTLLSAYWKYLVVLAIVLIGGYFYLAGGKSLGATLTVVPGDFATQVNISGTVIAAKDVDLGFATSGRVSGVYAQVGQHVEAGSLLASVENGDLYAVLQEKQATLDSLKAGTRPEQIAIAQSTVAGDQATLAVALQSAYTVADDSVHNKTDVLFTNPRTTPSLSFSVANATLKNLVERDRTLMEPALSAWRDSVTSITPSNASDRVATAITYLTQVVALLSDENAALNQAVADQSTSAATLSSYSSAIAIARTNISSAATALTNASSALADAQKSLALSQAGATASDLAVAQANVDNALAALAKTQVRAPFTGVVTRMDAKTGEVISPSTSQISMQSDGLFEVEVYVPEVSISGVAVGNPATTTLDAYGPTVAFSAKVVSVDPAETVKDGVPTYKTTLVFLTTDPRIRSGMTANVAITTGMIHNSIVIPSGAVGTGTNGSYVSVVVNKKAESRSVVVGIPPALGQATITSGLSAGDVILLTPVKQ